MRLGSPQGVEAHEVAVEACDTSSKSKQGCCSVLDAADARRVAGMLEIPFYVLNFQEDFGRVIDYFVSEYNRGRTPNPCVRCNDWLKFGKLAKYAEAVGADYVASGHYARVGTDPVTGQKCLMRGLDHRKDQSYVLFGMSRATMEHTLLPIGNYEKHEVRKIAEEMKLPVFNKPDSQEICFVPNQDYAGLVQRRSPETFRAGELVTTDGNAVGQHEGHQHFTIGQRKGVGVAFGYPIYVVDIDPEQNRVILGDKDALLKRTLIAHQINLLSDRLKHAGTERRELRDQSAVPDPSRALRCTAKIRYNHQPQPATLHVTGDDEIRVTFDDAQSAITPGQAVVCFDGDVVLGGGWIDAAE
jgi:tRNA-specific 2-thiouridylase